MIVSFKDQATEDGLNDSLDTLKEKLNQWSVGSLKEFNQDFHIFRFWYNKVRTHNNLNGKTPEEVWEDRNIQKYTSENTLYFN